MPFSYNGWSASPSIALRDLRVGPAEMVPGVRDNDDVYTVLKFIAEQWHENVEALRAGWCWGFSYRLTTNDNSLSCHASATAIDLNAPLHPFGVSIYANLNQQQIDFIRGLAASLPVVWGGDYRGSPDGMHWEIMGSAAAVKAAADRIRNGQMEDEMQQADFERIRAIVSSENDVLERKIENGNALNRDILVKLENSREREVVTTTLLRELRDEVDADSPTRRKLDRIIALQKVDAAAEAAPPANA